MIDEQYLYDIFSNIGIAIIPNNNAEIIIKLDILYDKKSDKYILENEYNVSYQPYGTIITDFLNFNFSNKDDFITFFNKYYLFGLENKKIFKLLENNNCNSNEYHIFLDKMYKKHKKSLTVLQKDIIFILEYCLYSPSKDIINLTPFERLCILEYTPNNPSLLQEKNMQIINMNILSNIEDINCTKKEIVEKLNNKNTKAYTSSLFIPNNLSSLLHYELSEIIKDNIYIKNCNYCNKYFIANNKKISYCNNIAPGYTDKTCKQVGRYKTFKNMRKKDNAIELFDKIYNNKAYKASRYKDINEYYVLDYKHYQKIGKKKLEKYKNKQISKEDFIEWIKSQ